MARFYHQHLIRIGRAIAYNRGMAAIRISQARPEQAVQVLELLTEISAWLAERGISQWPSPPGPEVRQLIAREIAAGEVYLAHQPGDDEAAGMLRFEWHDPYLWPADPIWHGPNRGGGYVHSLGVRPSYHGRGVGAAMLGWAAEHVRARGRRYLRLDCVADNWGLRRYYERLGFAFRGLASHDGYAGALFELDLAQDADGGGTPRRSA